MPGQPWYNTLAPPPPTAPPVLFEPPGDLTGKRNEIWLAAAGGAGWGGCEVWASVNDQSYDRIATIGPGAVIGTLSTPLPAKTDPDTYSSVEVNVGASRGELYPASVADADLFVTASWVNGEMLAFSAATLVGQHHYRLDRHIRRGLYKTPIKAHAAGTAFARLNQAIFRFPYPPHLVGSKIYVKLPAFNEHQQMLQTLDLVQSTSLMLTGDSAK